MKVHGMWYSNATGRVLATLCEKKVNFEVVPVNIMKGEQKKPEFLVMQKNCSRSKKKSLENPALVIVAVNKPFGQIPVLEDEDLKLYESRACMRYICDKFPDHGEKLYGSSPRDRALVEQWLEIESQECSGPMLDLVNQLLFGPLFHAKHPDASAVKSLTEKLGKVLDVYDTQLQKTKYLAGDFVSLADISHLPVCNYYFNIAQQHELLKTRKHVNRWWQDISGRPSWKRILEQAMPDIDKWKSAMV